MVFKQNGSTITGSSSTTSADIALSGSGGYLKIINLAPVPLFVKAGAGAQTAASSDFAIMPSSEAVMKISLADDHLALVTLSSGGFYAVSRGEI